MPESPAQKASANEKCLRTGLVSARLRSYQEGMLRVYAYAGCSTCRTAFKWLKTHNIFFEELPIRETPPSMKELRLMLKSKGDDLRALFNTSGTDYRSLKLKEKLPSMGTEEALSLLHENGNLVKRPFVCDDKTGVFLVGFKEPDWETAFPS